MELLMTRSAAAGYVVWVGGSCGPRNIVLDGGPDPPVAFRRQVGNFSFVLYVVV